VYIYGSYRKIKTGVPLFMDHPVGWPWVEFSCQTRFCASSRFRLRAFDFHYCV